MAIAAIVLLANGLLLGSSWSPWSGTALAATGDVYPAGSTSVSSAGSSSAISGTNIYRATDRMVIYTPSAGSVTPTNIYGAEAIVVAGKVTELRDRQSTGEAATPIPAEGVVLSGHGAARDWILRHAPAGATLTFSGGTSAAPSPSATASPSPAPSSTSGSGTSPAGSTSVTASGSTFAVSGTDTYRAADKLVIYTPAAGSVTPTNIYGAEATVSGGKVTVLRDRQSTGQGGTPIPTDGVVLSGHGAARDWILRNAQVGVPVLFSGGASASPSPSPSATTPTPTPSAPTTTPSPGATAPTPKPSVTPTASPSPTAGPSAPAGSGPGVASITFDDGQTGQYVNARPVLQSRAMKGTFYIVSDGMTWGPGHMGASQVRQLALEGHEVGNHTRTHANLSTLSGSQVEAEFAASQSAISSAAGVTPTTCAYPYGSYNSGVTATAARFFRACRSVSSGPNPLSGYSAYQLVTYYVRGTDTATTIRDAVRRAQSANQWIILTYHGVGAADTGDDVSTANFTGMMDAVKATGIPVKTVAQVVAG
ncbi:MAG: polysaccharide deacetylase [Frankiales bacterium]|nr:polysaccharide deacetylase [Frankiales bacterium]